MNQFRKLALLGVIAILVIIGAIVASRRFATATALEACGTQLGSFGTPLCSYQGEVVYSNGPVFTKDDGGLDPWGDGTEWQCVEFVQRFFSDKWGIKPGPSGSPGDWPGVGPAYSMFTHPPAGVVAYSATDTQHPPVPGDILVFNHAPGWSAGHVAIVSAVTSISISFVQQNISGHPARTLAFTTGDQIETDGHYPPVLGWLHAVKNTASTGTTTNASGSTSTTPKLDLNPPKTSQPSAQLKQPTPTPTPKPIPTPTPQKSIPGGEWMTPANGATTGPNLLLEAQAYPSHTGDPAISKVNFTLWWPGFGPKNGPWKIACAIPNTTPGDVYTCSVNLAALGVPPGPLTVSFDVYAADGGKNLSPNGEHTITYVQPAPTPTPQPAQAWIAFACPNGSDSSPDLCLIHPDGTGNHKIIDGPVSDPSWSPDGTKLAFVRATQSDPDPTEEIEIANADGSNQQVVVQPELPANTISTPVHTTFETPRLGPDGHTLYYFYYNTSMPLGYSGIRRLDLNTGAVTDLDIGYAPGFDVAPDSQVQEVL